MLIALLISMCTPLIGISILSAITVRPANLGSVAGRLAECPATPNAVCTQCGDAEHWIEPFHFQCSGERALAHLERIVRRLPRSQIITVADGYLHTEFTSRLFRFVDDVEFLIEPDTCRIHFRSASRTGYYDMEVNRNRMEHIRRAFETEDSFSREPSR